MAYQVDIKSDLLSKDWNQEIELIGMAIYFTSDMKQVNFSIIQESTIYIKSGGRYFEMFSSVTYGNDQENPLSKGMLTIKEKDSFDMVKDKNFKTDRFHYATVYGTPKNDYKKIAFHDDKIMIKEEEFDIISADAFEIVANEKIYNKVFGLMIIKPCYDLVSSAAFEELLNC